MGKKKFLLDTLNVVYNKTYFDILVIEFIYGCKIPVHVLDSPCFKDLIKSLCPYYFPPNSQTIVRELLHNMKSKILIESEQDDEGNHFYLREKPIYNYSDIGESNSSSSKKSRKDSFPVNVCQRNPVSILNELKRGVTYKTVEQVGPPHSPIFKVAVEVNGQKYIGRGGSKKLAKCKAAEKALQSFIQLPNNVNVARPVSSSVVDFTSDRFEANSANAVPSEDVSPNLPQTVPAENHNQTKSPVMILNEMYPRSRYECLESSSDVYSRYKVVVTVGDDKFVGIGSRKKSAKHAAATAALNKLLGESVMKSGMFLMSPYRRQNVTVEQQQLADHVGRLVLEKFGDLMKNDPFHARRKVISGIVMTRGSDLSDSEIVGITTGTKCVSGDHMSMHGASVNDLHAEILARRCLLVYLYDQLELLLDNLTKDNDSIFEPRVDRRGFQLKEHIGFHLYINTAPCGDARIFSPHEDSKDIDLHPHRNSRGQLRTKIESGEGTIPIKFNIIQTWDGLLQGERLLTMACSDKIARWNVLGLQGALLSNFVDPIYLKSITLGSLFKESHLYRAICGRVETTLQGLPPPFLLNRPQMLSTTSSETRHPAKAPCFSVNWVKGCTDVEIINTTVGKPDVGFSRLCKQNFMKRFIKIYNKVRVCSKLSMDLPILYYEAKEMAKSYNIAKKQMMEAFSKAGLGTWVKKPVEQEQFGLENSGF
ncbi:hypothetical protein FQR65_LT08996 [Abscondita terminalis]|nr:hypothetical protein FQR65_LT08996 [Abscondita terminalis]